MITTKEDWWKALDDNWENFLTCAGYVKAPVEDIAKASEAKGAREFQTVLSFLNNVWFAAPDRPEIHTWPSWNTLCLLCSEDWVFQEEPAR